MESEAARLASLTNEEHAAEILVILRRILHKLETALDNEETSDDGK